MTTDFNHNDNNDNKHDNSIKKNGHHNLDPNNDDHNDNNANKQVQMMPDVSFGP